MVDGLFIKDNVDADLLITYGELAKNMHEYMKENYAKCEAMHFSDRSKLDDFLKETLLPNDVVLFKGSNSMKLFESVDHITDRK